MTAYVVFYTNASAAPVLSIRAVTYALRIAKLECAVGVFTSPSSFTNGNITYSRYSPATQSGGTAVGSTPYRDGAPTASATAKTGATLSGGTSSTFNIDIGTASLPFNITIAPGDAFVATPSVPAGSTGSLNSITIQVHFEELRINLNS